MPHPRTYGLLLDAFLATWLGHPHRMNAPAGAAVIFRREVRVRARACLGGMLSGLKRKTAWSLAERAGEMAPDGMQRL